MLHLVTRQNNTCDVSGLMLDISFIGKDLRLSNGNLTTTGSVYRDLQRMKSKHARIMSSVPIPSWTVCICTSSRIAGGCDIQAQNAV
ncbi:hypothetical protein J6590_092587 [Homalodisca vitripennis]|nr:hypothetical protein J6590_092587 [Homalodisca vitripennis]